MELLDAISLVVSSAASLLVGACIVVSLPLVLVFLVHNEVTSEESA